MKNKNFPVSLRLVALAPALWLTLFFVIPFLVVLRLSLSDPAAAQPPYRPVFDLAQGIAGVGAFVAGLDLENYITAATDSLYLAALFTSLRLAALGTLCALLIGYPMAHAIAKAGHRLQPILIMLVILPFWTSFLIRVYAWIGILKQEGLLNQLLLALGVTSRPLVILDTEIAVVIGITYAYLPFMVLPIFAALVRLDRGLVEAAGDLGASPFAAWRHVVLPLAMPGIIAGCLLVFIPAVGEFIIPDLLGGSETLMLGRTLWSEFFSNRDWPLASTIAVLLLGVILVPAFWSIRLQQRQDSAA
jgi:putrescine transport system permease protein